MDTIDSFCAQLARSKLLAPDAVRTIHKRWRGEAKGDGDNVALFSKWLVTNGFLTDFQIGVLQRGFAELLFLDDYKLLERIGQGRMAGVYKAVHKVGQVVAIKVLPLAKGKDARVLARFQREARMALMLRHPNCVRSFQVGTTQGGLHYIVMEYLDGETLDEVLKRRGRLPLSEALQVVTQALRGLAHIGEVGLVHRDLKPGNLMLTPAAEETALRSQVKILDIGLGRELFDESNAEGDAEELTMEHTVLGSPAYMAPDQAKDAHGADIRADIYSLGCVLFQCLTGQTPFVDARSVEQIARHATEQIRPLKAVLGDVPTGVQEALDKMLAKNPGERFATPALAIAALERLQGGGRGAAIEGGSAPMPSYLRWVEQGRGDDVGPPPTPAEVLKTEYPVSQGVTPPPRVSAKEEYVAVPMMAPVAPSAGGMSRAELARRRSLGAALVALAVLVVGGIAWAVWAWFF